MTDILNTGKSALFAFQRALGTTSHNIANVNTEGYARQRVDLEGVPGNTGLYNQPGSGVSVAGIERIHDEFATARVNSSTSAYEEQLTHQVMASRLDSLVATDGSSVGPAMSDFFNAIQDVNTDPSSIAAREVALDATNQLTDRFQSMQSQLDDIQTEVNDRTKAAVTTVGELAESIALVNKQVMSSGKSTSASATNDLMDQRDRLINELSKYVEIDTISHESGALNVFMGKGIALVIGSTAQNIKTTPDDTYPDRLQIQIGKEGSEKTIDTQLQGGEIGGLAEFANQTLRPAMNDLGRLALTMADTLNQQHGSGLDLDGNVGTDLFEVPTPQVYSNSRNTGSGAITAAITDSGALEATDYLVRFDGANYTATRSSDGEETTGSSNTLLLDGLELTMTSGAAVGDTFVISATGRAAGQISTVITDVDKLAVAGQLTTSSDIANTGESRISSAKVVDAANGSLQDPVDIVFTSENSYEIHDASGATLQALQTYTSGDPINFNGWEVSISDDAAAGDIHHIEPNTLGKGDNSNGLALADMQQETLVAGTQTFNDAYGTLVSKVGSQTNAAMTRASALESLKDNAIERQQSVQSVSLDEEAIDLTRYQQAYQAAAKIITTADEMFQTILGAVR
ncbi:flagellar hook-associated protein FlgK [Granulosicoccus antarcticus]|uniref:Flagellar hook-associated protein 1 n=1 Tax=Granulosicoccus antarcticus IMCC3135 TaxID=1192854 RepID=A0A2Z2NPE2_9GAMM|nr:flagellar hook-associated protein FlgK [Granulosicoccus antarcticus]ASJ71801.1 Flagellar hook-associated protein 1 [Granulosicoccus antarcticus IMCC3135]